MGKHETKIPVGRLKYRRENTIKMGFSETGVSVWTGANQLSKDKKVNKMKKQNEVRKQKRYTGRLRKTKLSI
jgi:hypothetical protein